MSKHYVRLRLIEGDKNKLYCCRACTISISWGPYGELRRALILPELRGQCYSLVKLPKLSIAVVRSLNICAQSLKEFKMATASQES